MAAPNEIRSTEKLLELIRTPSIDQADEKISNEHQQITKTKRPSLIQSIKLQKKITVGVDIGHTYIRIAKTLRLADKSYKLLDYLDIPLNKQASLQDSFFLERLKSALDQVCDDGGVYDIWSTISSAKVETRCLRIPKVPRKQMHNAIFWTFTKKVAFNEQEEQLDYEILGEVEEAGVKKIEVLAFNTPKSEVIATKAAFDQIGYPLKGISIAPFAIQNLFRASIINPPEQDVCCLFVGRDWSRIAIYSNGNLILSRGIKAGMHSMVEAIDIAMFRGESTWPDEVPALPEIDADEKNSRIETIHPDARNMFFTLLGTQGNRSETSTTQENTDPAQVFQMILPALERLMRQVERTFEHYAMNFHREGVRRIYLSGQITANAMIVNHFGRQMDLPIEVMNPFQPESPFVRAVNIPETMAQRESYVPAIGLALSQNAITPNCLFTHQHRDQEESVRRINMRVLTGCMVCLMALIGIFSFQERRLETKRAQIDQLNAQLLAFNPPAEKEILLALYSQNKNKHQAFRQIVQRYASVALINELALTTPANIRLISVEADLAGATAKDKAAVHGITMEGIIFGTTENFETELTGYLLRLKNSPMFSKPSIVNKSVENYNAQEVLRFKVKLEMI